MTTLQRISIHAFNVATAVKTSKRRDSSFHLLSTSWAGRLACGASALIWMHNYSSSRLNIHLYSHVSVICRVGLCRLKLPCFTIFPIPDSELIDPFFLDLTGRQA